MKVHCWLFVVALLLAALTGCSTPDSRARERPAAFHRLPAADQQLVLRGKIHTGMDKDAVYIAWGGPDLRAEGGKGQEGSESWYYERLLTVTEPFGATDQYGPYHGMGFPPVPLTLQQGYGFRGLGDNAFQSYQPHVRIIDVRYRRAEFSNGKLVQYVDRPDGFPPLNFKPAPIAPSVANAHTPPVARKPDMPRHLHRHHRRTHHRRIAHPVQHPRVDQPSATQ